ncbi:MAG: hypothetical protein NVS2B7_05690 [Herpetosiphon sp.]
MRRVLLAVPDLMFNARIGDVVRRLGGTATDVSAATVGSFLHDAELLVVDSDPKNNGMAVVQALRMERVGATIPVLAFGAHVDVAAQRMAVAAGCDRVVTRGKLAAELPQLLQETLQLRAVVMPDDEETL